MKFSELNFAGFTRLKNDILKELNGLKTFSEDQGLSQLSSIISEAIKKLQEEGFKIVVVGEFSRGKSSFINALLGEKALPSSVRPTTATINLINYADKPFSTVYYHKIREPRQMSIEELKKYVVPKEPLEDDEEAVKKFNEINKEIQEIKWIEIFYPIELCKNGVQIIDTPGVNDINEAREEVTYKFIPQADAAVFILDCQQPLSSSETKFLKDRILKNQINKIFFVLNKADQLDSEADKNKVISYLNAEISKFCINPKIFPVSSKMALEGKKNKDADIIKNSLILEFENNLTSFLLSEKGKMLLEYPLNKAISVLADLKNHFTLELSINNNSIEDLELKIKEFEKIVRDAHLKKSVIYEKLNFTFAEQRKSLKDKFENFINNLISNFILKIDSCNDSAELQGLTKATSIMLKDEIKGWLDNESQLIADFFHDTILKFRHDLSDAFVSVDNFIKKEITCDKTHEISSFNGVTEVSYIENNEEGMTNENRNVSLNFGGNMAIGFVAATIFGGPIAIIAMIIGGAMYNAYQESIKLNSLKDQIKTKLNNDINDVKDGILNQIIASFNKSCIDKINDINKSFNSRIENITSALNNTLEEKRSKEFANEQKKAKLNELISVVDKKSCVFSKIKTYIN